MQQFTSLLSLRWGDHPYFQKKKHAEEAEWSVLGVRPRVLLPLYPSHRNTDVLTVFCMYM